MKIVNQAFRLFLILTLITGLVYPLIVTVLGYAFCPSQADGSLVLREGKVIGSSLICQKFIGKRYFWARPSAVDYNPLPSGGSNQGMTSALLDSAVGKRRRALTGANPGSERVPSDLLFASGSGLDPDISPEAARFQVDRVAAARGLDNEEKIELIKLVEEHIKEPDFGILGEPRINVLMLNLALDSTFVDNGQ